MKKPPYKVYKGKGKEGSPIEIPDKVDTPQAEQLVSDIYKLIDFLSKHRVKLLVSFALLLIIGGSFLGYSIYVNSVERSASELVDKGLYYLERGDREKALSYFEKALNEYRGAPSSNLAKFLIGKLKVNDRYLNELSGSSSYLLSPPSKTTLLTWGIDSGKLPKFKVKRDEWTHPEYLYDRLLIALKEGKKEEAKDIFNSLSGDYGSLPITSLAERLIE